MRFIEAMDWVLDDRLVVCGSLNPSRSECVVVDVASGREVKSYIVDGLSFAVSPDGMNVAYQGWIPHFTPEANRRPQLCFDDECLFDQPFRGHPGPDQHVEFVAPPVWNETGTAVAAAWEDYETKALALVVRSLRGGIAVHPVPSSTPTGVQVSWDGDTAVIVVGEEGWALPSGHKTLVSVDLAEDGSGRIQAGTLRRKIALALQSELGATDFDSWCESCLLRRNRKGVAAPPK